MTSPTTWIEPRYALLTQDSPRAFVGTEQELGHRVDLDARVLLGHREIAAPKAGLDVCDWKPRVLGGTSSSESGVGVTVNEDEIGSLLSQHVSDSCCHPIGIGGLEFQPVARLRQAELLEEHVREPAVVVLTRVNDDLVESHPLECNGERRRLHELRAISDDGDDLHGWLG